MEISHLGDGFNVVFVTEFKIKSDYIPVVWSVWNGDGEQKYKWVVYHQELNRVVSVFFTSNGNKTGSSNSFWLIWLTQALNPNSHFTGISGSKLNLGTSNLATKHPRNSRWFLVDFVLFSFHWAIAISKAFII